MRAGTYVFALLPLGAIWAFVMAQSTSEIFALMDQVAISPRASAPEAPPMAAEPIHTRAPVQAAPLDLEYDPADDPEIDEHEPPRSGDEYPDETYVDPDLYDDFGVDYYEERPPVRLPAYPVAEPEPEYPSVGDPRIDALLRRAVED